MDGIFFGESSVEVLVYAADSLQEEEDACLQAVFKKPEDVLLHQVKGRYLWFKVILAGQKGREPEISRMQIYFPKDTWLKYLPEVYQNDVESASFLERYLAIFQSVYEDMTKRIRADTGSAESGDITDGAFAVAGTMAVGGEYRSLE